MEEPSVVIHADVHEKDTIVSKILQKRCDVRFHKLISGDYCLSKRLGVERKTVPDFLQSIIDKRLFSQLRELKRNFSKPLLLIEGNGADLYSLRQMNENAIRGALSSIVTGYSIPILWTHSPHESAEMLLSLARREQLKLKKSTGLREKKKFKSLNQHQLFLLSGLPGVSDEKAKALLKFFGSPSAVFAATDKELMEVGGIGKILAKRIRFLLKRNYEKSILED
ncbi:MAG: hypothetical protein HYW25_01210 [Candidatus Aenigmarchaeota archaeon]|nr:hypothetical protein [Candidatus Aenigmarchaeota archaeon]